jgi:hypothetical protein
MTDFATRGRSEQSAFLYEKKKARGTPGPFVYLKL